MIARVRPCRWSLPGAPWARALLLGGPLLLPFLLSGFSPLPQDRFDPQPILHRAERRTAQGVGVSTWEHPRTNFTGDPYVTDGLRAVLWLSSAPVSYHRVVTRWPRPESDQPLPDPRRTPRP